MRTKIISIYKKFHGIDSLDEGNKIDIDFAEHVLDELFGKPMGIDKDKGESLSKGFIPADHFNKVKSEIDRLKSEFVELNKKLIENGKE